MRQLAEEHFVFWGALGAQTAGIAVWHSLSLADVYAFRGRLGWNSHVAGSLLRYLGLRVAVPMAIHLVQWA